MFLSQKGSLGRNPMINRVGQRLLQLFEGASAAYSLRDLASNIASVVRVRRASDNSEKDFSAADVSSGAMTQWVNGQVVPPLDVRELVDGERTGALIPAAAAYSLRNLSTSYTGDVVDVRRSSDNALEAFSAAQVADGTLTDWVNADIDKLDLQIESGGLIGNVTNETATGFDFSVNNEGSDGYKNLLPTANVSAGNYTTTFDVVLNSGSLTGCTLYNANSGNQQLIEGANSLTLTPDAASNIFFYILGTASADVSITNLTLTQTTADGFVAQWYDQSGNNNHATQTDAASQPKIVDAGSLLANGLTFDGSDDKLNMPNDLIASINSASSFLVAKSDTSSSSRIALALSHSTSNFRFYVGALLSSKFYFGYQDTALKIELSAADTNKHLFTSIAGSSNTEAFLDGTSKGTVSSVDGKSTLSSGGIGSINTGNFWSGTIQEVIVYNTDQSANRTAFEANIGETYGIDLPSGVDTGYDQVDGFVETWYDQSGNGNDAVQATAGSQPKIVDAGVLVSGNTGEPAFRGDGVDDILSLSSSIDFGTGEFFVSTVVDVDTGGVAIGSGANWLLLVTLSSIQVRASNTRVVYVISPDSVLTAGESYLISLSRVENNITAYVNGVAQADVETVVSTDTFSADRFLQRGTNSNPYSDPVSEVIVYASDQSANRVAIETNINNQYDIY